MSENNQQPTKFEPKIPMWMQPHYDAMPPHEQWKCDMASVQEQQNNWLMEHAMRADEHRTHINKVVEDLKQEVRPAVRLASLVLTVKGAIVALLTLIGVPTLVAIIGEWIKSKFHGP